MYGLITDIKRMAVHDGRGIRTTVFFKGCPLKCVWCHNPEGMSSEKEIAYFEEKCMRCGRCAKICSVHRFDGNMHTIDKSRCDCCGKCAAGCENDAIKIYGRKIDDTELVKIMSEDKVFYEESDGGVTLSGGECLAQPRFAEEVLKGLKKNGINTAVDTCGFVKWEVLERIMKYTDTFLYDMKAFNEETHIKCTGVSNTLIKQNLIRLGENGAETEIRIPYVPGYNSDETELIAEFLSGIKGITGVRLLPYHNLSQSKYSALGRAAELPACLPSKEEIQAAEEILKRYNLNVI